MFTLLTQTMNVTAPVFLMLLLGVLLRRWGWIDTAFVNGVSRLVFKGTLPALLFLAILKADLSVALNPSFIIYFIVATLATFILAWAWALWRCPQIERGVYVQGAFRGNNGIVGLALATSLYGDYGLSVGGLLAGVVILLYNSLSAMILEIYSDNGKTTVKGIALSIAKNPLIIGVLSAIPFAYWQIALPEWFMRSAQGFAQMSLPLALLCIGATLTVAALREGGKLAMSSSLMKVLWLPVLATLGAWWFGFRGPDLGILFLYFASPTAAASFVMVQAVGSNHQLAASIIALTTVLSVITINAGVFILQWLEQASLI